MYIILPRLLRQLRVCPLRRPPSTTTTTTTGLLWPNLSHRPAYQRSISSRSNRNSNEDLYRVSGIKLEDLDSLCDDKDGQESKNRYLQEENIPRAYPADQVAEHDETSRRGNQKSVYVCQPWVSYNDLALQTRPELQLAEAVSLANTIPNWTVTGKSVLLSAHQNLPTVVGERALEELRHAIRSSGKISAVFFSVSVLSGVQLQTLEKELGLPVYDRFTVVLNIFRHHATSREAKLQVALAEIPYLRSHLRQIHDSAYSTSTEQWKSLVGGSGDTYYHKRLAILKQREVKINALLKDLRGHREASRMSRVRKQLPTVSVVGYTNSGKTSLIKAITEDERLKPKDQLFATLDITGYMGSLPSNRSVVFVDSVGFISRIPTLLTKAFEATLAELKESDLLVHVLDINHPDHKLQRSTVIKALTDLSLPKSTINSMLTIGNKFDLAQTNGVEIPNCDLVVSVKTGHNMNALVGLIDQRLCRTLDKQAFTIRALTGGDEYRWLRTNSSMINQVIDESDENYTLCKVVMSDSDLGKFKKRFSDQNIMNYNFIK